jgi:hypothetical protein
VESSVEPTRRWPTEAMGGEARQYGAIDVVVSENLLVLFEPEPAQPPHDIHAGQSNPPGAPVEPLDDASGSAALDHAARVQDVGRVEGVLDPARQCGERRRLRLEHRDRAAQCL